MSITLFEHTTLYIYHSLIKFLHKSLASQIPLSLKCRYTDNNKWQHDLWNAPTVIAVHKPGLVATTPAATASSPVWVVCRGCGPAEGGGGGRGAPGRQHHRRRPVRRPDRRSGPSGRPSPRPAVVPRSIRRRRGRGEQFAGAGRDRGDGEDASVADAVAAHNCRLGTETQNADLYRGYIKLQLSELDRNCSPSES